jgi:uncharacterized protein (UPF0332 family)
VRSKAGDALAKARQCLVAAKAVLAVGLPGVAATQAYLAAYHAGHAFVIERTGKAVKTHRGLRASYARLARDESLLDPGFSQLLGQGYKFKEVADYAAGPAVDITNNDARHPIDGAARFIDAVAALLADSS